MRKKSRHNKIGLAGVDEETWEMTLPRAGGSCDNLVLLKQIIQLL